MSLLICGRKVRLTFDVKLRQDIGTVVVVFPISEPHLKPTCIQTLQFEIVVEIEIEIEIENKKWKKANYFNSLSSRHLLSAQQRKQTSCLATDVLMNEKNEFNRSRHRA